MEIKTALMTVERDGYKIQTLAGTSTYFPHFCALNFCLTMLKENSLAASA